MRVCDHCDVLVFARKQHSTRNNRSCVEWTKWSQCRTWYQCSRSGWNSGETQGQIQRACLGSCIGHKDGVKLTSLQRESCLERGVARFPEFSLEMACFSEFWGAFCRALSRKNIEFSVWSGYLVDVKDILLGRIVTVNIWGKIFVI